MKKLLIYLGLLFNISLIMFTPNVKAEEAYTLHHIDELELFDHEITEDYLYSTFDIDKTEYPYVFMWAGISEDSPKKDSTVYANLFFHKTNPYLEVSSRTDYWNFHDYNNNTVNYIRITEPGTPWFDFKIGSKKSITSNYTKNVNSNGIYTTSAPKNLYYFSNYDIVYHDTKEVVIPSSKPKSYNVTFHLNGGTVYDNNYITDSKGTYIIGNKYDDYTVSIYANNFKEYLQNQDVKKVSMDFKGWYYDEKLTLKVNSNDVLTGDTNLYAKFLYTDVESFLKNTTFNTYTFDTDYEYAIISLNDKTNRDIYLGLNFMSYDLEVYKYNKVDLNYGQGPSICLTPYYSKDNKYYYYLNSPLDEDYEAIIIPKGKFKDENYEFLLSKNAYVTYTNDLNKVIIKNDDGQDIETNLSNSYNYSQDALLNNENNIIEIFKKLAENKNNNVFSYFNQIWNYIKRSKLYTYLLILIIGSLIVLIIHVAKR